ncbi:MAG: Wzz/FepE/Etk N-terminal domain-containing protein [candidate division Zixibacteria bacterium]|nr:Wzz/FepE/Etk N-terminal domain-containing protein [candidate division Zixibacteria bacterium]
MEETEFNLWRLLEIITLRIKFVIIFVLVMAVISAMVSLLLPKWYKASTLLLPPKEESLKFGQGGIEDMISITAGLTLPIMATPTDIYARILKSRTIAERVIAANNLAAHYKMKSIVDILEELDKRSDFYVTDEGLLEITYKDKDPGMAAAVASSFTDELYKMNREFATARARTMREFIAGRLKEVFIDLDSARVALREFQSHYKAIDLDQQTQLAIQAAVNLKVALAENEIELNVMEKSLSPTHPEVVNLRRKIEQIRNQISSLEYGSQDSSYFSLPVSEMPVLKIKFAELTAKVKISETLYQVLSEQYEQAKIQEKANTPTLSILDKPYIPELPYRPQKTIIVLISTGLSFFLAIFIVLFQNYLTNLQKNFPEDYRRIQLFGNTCFGWLPGFGIKKK